MPITVNEVSGDVVIAQQEQSVIYVEQLTPPVVAVFEVGIQGPPGPPGPPGGAAYTHVQISASAVWFVQHDLGRRPHVTVVDSADTKVYGDIQYLNDSQLEISFTAPFSGKAYVA
jgi:hypothetical protein